MDSSINRDNARKIPRKVKGKKRLGCKSKNISWAARKGQRAKLERDIDSFLKKSPPAEKETSRGKRSRRQDTRKGGKGSLRLGLDRRRIDICLSPPRIGSPSQAASSAPRRKGHVPTQKANVLGQKHLHQGESVTRKANLRPLEFS